MNNSQTNDSNPCCSGQWSRTFTHMPVQRLPLSLNPCCSGRWSRTLEEMKSACNGASISLNPCCSGQWSRTLEKMLKQDVGEVS